MMFTCRESSQLGMAHASSTKGISAGSERRDRLAVRVPVVFA